MHKTEQLNPYKTASAQAAWSMTRRQYFNLMTKKVWVGGETNRKTGIKSPTVPVYKIAGRPKELFHWQVAYDICGMQHYKLIRAQIERSKSLAYLSADNFVEYQPMWKKCFQQNPSWSGFRNDGT